MAAPSDPTLWRLASSRPASAALGHGDEDLLQVELGLVRAGRASAFPQRQDPEPRDRAYRAQDAARRQIPDRLGDGRIEVGARGPAQISTHRRRRGLGELTRQRAEPGAFADLPDHALGGLADRRLLVGPGHRQEDLAEAITLLALDRLEPRQGLRHLVVADPDPPGKAAMHQLGPGYAGAKLRAERIVTRPAFRQDRRQVPGRHAIGPLHVRDAERNFVFRNRHVAFPGFLQLEAFVDQRAKHLVHDPPARLGGVPDSRQEKHQPDSVPEIADRDDLVIDDHRNPLHRLGKGARRRRDQAGEKKDEYQAHRVVRDDSLGAVGPACKASVYSPLAETLSISQ